MGVIRRVVRPKTQRSKRALLSREPKAIENTKTALFIRGQKCSNHVLTILKDFRTLKKPHVAPEFYGKKNEIRPFEDVTPVEMHCKKHDCSLFMFGNHSKKRPHNLIIGRLFDSHVLDMVELAVIMEDNSFKTLQDIKASGCIPLGTKPCLTFSGVFQKDDTMKRIQNLLIDFFRGPAVTNIRMSGLEHVIQFTAVEENSKFKIFVRSYMIHMKKSGGRIPRVELDEIGPRLDLEVKRTHLASEDLFKSACKQVKNVDKAKKVKNVSQDGLGTKLGRVHVPAQNIGSIQTRKMKGLKDTPEEKKLEKMKAKKAKSEAVRKANVQAVFGGEED